MFEATVQAQRAVFSGNVSELSTNTTQLEAAVTSVVDTIVSATREPATDTNAFVPETQAFIDDYVSFVANLVEDESVPVETRFTAVADQTSAVAEVVTAIGGSKLSDDSFAITFAEGLLNTARSLSRVFDVAPSNESASVNATIVVPSSPAITGGFIKAIDLSDPEVNVVARYPEDSSDDASAIQNPKVSNFVIHVTQVLPTGTNRSVALAATIVELSSDTMFPDSRSGPDTLTVVSSILLASLGVPISGLSDSDRICGTYRHAATEPTVGQQQASATEKQSNSAPVTPRCVYYNHASSTWDGDGCQATFLNATHITCCCNHLTAFAVVVGGEEVHGEDAAALEWITSVGLGVSLVCLMATMMTIAGSRELRMQLQNKLLFNLALALAVSHLLFFFIAVPTDVPTCRAVSLTTMYFLLASFGWMSIQAHSLYTTFVMADVWDLSKHQNAIKLAKYSGFAWGIPLLCVAAAATIDLNGTVAMSSLPSGNEAIQFCFFDRTSMVKWFFIGPMLGAVSYNMFAAIRVIQAVYHRLHRNVHTDRDFKSKLQQIATDMKVVLVIASVTGCGWGLAVLVVFQVGGTPMQYAFTVATVFQGTLIFNFHVLQKRPGRAFLVSVGRSLIKSFSRWSQSESSSGGSHVQRGPRATLGASLAPATSTNQDFPMTTSVAKQQVPWRLTYAPTVSQDKPLTSKIAALDKSRDGSSGSLSSRLSAGDFFPTSKGEPNSPHGDSTVERDSISSDINSIAFGRGGGANSPVCEDMDSDHECKIYDDAGGSVFNGEGVLYDIDRDSAKPLREPTSALQAYPFLRSSQSHSDSDPDGYIQLGEHTESEASTSDIEEPYERCLESSPATE